MITHAILNTICPLSTALRGVVAGRSQILGATLIAGLLTVLLAGPSSATQARTISLSAPSQTTPSAYITAHGYLSHTPIGSLVIIRRKSATSWVQVAATRTTTSADAYSDSIRAPATRGTFYYDAYAPRTSTATAALSTTVAVTVRTRVKVTLSASALTPPSGSTTTLSGMVSPWVPGTPVTLDRRVGSATTWTAVAPLSPDATGRFTRRVLPPSLQTSIYRVVVSTRGFYTSAVSPSVTITPQSPPPVGAPPTAPAVTDDPTSTTFAAAPGSLTDPVAGFRYSNVSAAVVSSGGGAYVGATNGQAQVPLPAASGLQHLYVMAVSQDAATSPVVDHLYALPVAGWSPTTPDVGGSTGPWFDGSTYGTTVACPAASDCIATIGDQYTTFDGQNWRTPQPITTAIGGGTIGALACGGPTFCVGVDSAGEARQYDGTSWSPPVPVAPSGLLNADLSCPSTTFCMLEAQTRVGVRFYVYNAGVWSSGANLDPSDSSWANADVTCPASSYCLATVNGSSYKWNGQSWSAAISFPLIGPVGCLAANQCIAVDQNGSTWTFDGTSWSGPTPSYFPNSIAGINGRVGSLHCFSSVCVAAAGDSVVYYNGSNWDRLAKSGGYAFSGVACTLNYCLAYGVDGSATDTVITPNSTMAVDQLPTVDGAESISCTADTWCRVSAAGIQTTSSSGGVWSQQRFPLQPNPLTASYEPGGHGDLSCISSTFCMSVGEITTYGSGSPSQQMAYSTYDGTAWTTPTTIPTQGDDALHAVSCVSPTFCMASDGTKVSIWNGSSWGPFQEINNGSALGVNAISCVDTTFCVAAGGVSSSGYLEGAIAVYRLGIWQGPATVDTQAPIADVSCPSTHFCTAVDTWGAVVMYNGSSWTQSQELGTIPTYLAAPPQPNTTSCGSPTLCVTLSQGESYVWNGSTWSTGQIIDPWAGASLGPDNPYSSLVDVSCGTKTTCSVIDSANNVLTYTVR